MWMMVYREMDSDNRNAPAFPLRVLYGFQPALERRPQQTSGFPMHLDQTFPVHLHAVMVSGLQMAAARAVSNIGLFFSEPTIAVPIKNHAPHPRDCSGCCYPPHGGASKTPPSELALAVHWNLTPLRSASLRSLPPFPSVLLRLNH